MQSVLRMVCENLEAVNAVTGEAGRLFTLSKLGTLRRLYTYSAFVQKDLGEAQISIFL